MVLSCNLTLRTLDVATRTYTESTVKGFIFPQGGNSSSFPLSNLAKYAHNLFIPTPVEEGDQITDSAGVTYEIVNVQPQYTANRFEGYFPCELIRTVSVTLKALTLGAQDSTAGIYAQTYGSATISMNLSPKGQSHMQTALGYATKYEVSGVTSAIVYEGDLIQDAEGTIYEVKQVAHYPTKRSTAFSYSVCALVKTEYAQPPTTSGTWHADSNSLTTDPRFRQKHWIDEYAPALAPTALLENNGATAASYITCFDNVARYPLSRVFLTKNVDLVFGIDKTESVALKTSAITDYKPYAFEETCLITAYAVDKAGLTAANLVEQAEQLIRDIATDHPLGSIRSIDKTKYGVLDIGGTAIHYATIAIKYKRRNDDFTPAYPSFTYGNDFIYEADRLSGGSEGTWTESGAGTTTVDSEKNLVIAGDSTVETTTAGNDLGLSTTVDTRARIRYKTSGGATIALATDDQLLLNAVSSSPWTVADVALTAGNTLDHFSIHNAAHAGNAYIDFIQVYRGAYIIPNVVKQPRVMKLKDAMILIPGMSGDITQGLGSELIVVEFVCDLDIEPRLQTWKRPQAATPKTDYNNDAIFRELDQQQGNTELWCWLKVGNPAMQFKARLLHHEVNSDGENNLLSLYFVEYRHGTAANETAVERFGEDLT